MGTNINQKLAERSSQTPARYGRKFARRAWRMTFKDDATSPNMSPAWHVLRQKGHAGDFGKFIGRTTKADKAAAVE